MMEMDPENQGCIATLVQILFGFVLIAALVLVIL